MRVVATPAFMALDVMDRTLFTRRAMELLGATAGSEPSMAFGKTDVTQVSYEDEGRSVRIPCKGEGMWAKRDDHPNGPVVTFMLPSDW